MATHAYPEMYVSNAMTTLGIMLDYAVNYRHEHIDYFFRTFINMGFAMQFEIGNPDVIVGKSGVELYRMIKCDYTTSMPEYFSFDRTPVFWIGWSLAYTQWYTGRTFRELSETIPLSEMVYWYPTLHEADLMRFVEAVEAHFEQNKSNLQRRREMVGLSQTQLSNLSGVSLRSIQMYEQKKNNIGNAQYNHLCALANTLMCRPEDLMDISTTPNLQNNPVDGFRVQLIRNIEENNRRLAELQVEQQRIIEQQYNQMRYDYIAQFPFQYVNSVSGTYYISQQTLSDNWNQFWTNRSASMQSEEQRQMLKTIMKKMIEHAVEQQDNKELSQIFYGCCFLTADNLLEAIEAAIKLVYTYDQRFGNERR